MTEREKVIKGLEYGINDDIDTPSCPYYEDGRVDIGLTREVPVNLLRDALALLKAQEPLKPKLSVSGILYKCRACGRPLTKYLDEFCPKCGRPVQWND